MSAAEQEQVHLHIRRGRPTPEELAALTAVLYALTAQNGAPTESHPPARTARHTRGRPPSWTEAPAAPQWTTPTSAAPAPSWRRPAAS